MMMEPQFFNRDLSWLSFNQRILEEAAKQTVPLLERIKFLAIYSSNLDEFYRIRMPVLAAIKKINKRSNLEAASETNVYKPAVQQIQRNQEWYADIVSKEIVPALRKERIHLLYNERFPDALGPLTEHYFFTKLAAFLEVRYMHAEAPFFPANNQIYLAVVFQEPHRKMAIVNVPTNVPRFFTTKMDQVQYIAFIDDIIRRNLHHVFVGDSIKGIYSFKVTRNADLEWNDVYEEDLARMIEEKIRKRDFGLATRLLYQPAMPPHIVCILMEICQLRKSNTMVGGNYHNLRDFFSLPVFKKEWKYPEQPPVLYMVQNDAHALYAEIKKRDILISTPYESYDTVLRFFNEAAFHPHVEEIYTTVYRVAPNSKILQALLTAVKNGKKVTVFVELKARFDEANNIKWAKEMKAAGVHVLYSFADIKVHAKVALIRKKENGQPFYYGLFSTGNLNEHTADVYADHILLTAHQAINRELESLFLYLIGRKNQQIGPPVHFNHLWVAGFNLMEALLKRIDREMELAKQGRHAEITIKLNNLEEATLIKKLYEANNAGVKINLIVRSICRLVPGVAGMSENIQIRRIVDRYLEHSRIFIFSNGGSEVLYMGSADWMYRNIYNRIEVCFPLYDPGVCKQIKDQIAIQLQDDLAAVWIDAHLQNVPVAPGQGLRAQTQIYQYIRKKSMRT